MYYKYQGWIDDPVNCIYLGSEQNPRTRFKYDYWVIRTHGRTGWSSTARHGMEPHEYGSQSLDLAWYDDSAFSHSEDFCFGIYRAKQLGVYWLATKEKPLLKAKEFWEKDIKHEPVSGI